MTTGRRTPWTELLSHRFDDVGDEYGPNSHVAASAFEALDEIRWLERAGAPLDDSRVVVARSWEDALTILYRDRGHGKYNVMGLLQAPCTRVDQVYERHPERHAWWQRAREEAKRYTLLGGQPSSRPREDRDLMFEHLYEYVSMLLAEIIASPEADCTYFRDQLEWFYAGHFPCGGRLAGRTHARVLKSLRATAMRARDRPGCRATIARSQREAAVGAREQDGVGRRDRD